MATIEDLVPENHFLRKREDALDLGFVYEKTTHLYSRKYERPPIDPVAMVFTDTTKTRGSQRTIKLPVDGIHSPAPIAGGAVSTAVTLGQTQNLCEVGILWATKDKSGPGRKK